MHAIKKFLPSMRGHRIPVAGCGQSRLAAQTAHRGTAIERRARLIVGQHRVGNDDLAAAALMF